MQIVLSLSYYKINYSYLFLIFWKNFFISLSCNILLILAEIIPEPFPIKKMR